MVDEPLLAELRTAFADCSEHLLRSAARESQLILSPMVEGVRQEDLNSLERTLRALLAEYQAADQSRRKRIRRLVITAKTHAQFAARHKTDKHEMVLWLRTWLENPPLFPAWVEMRRQVIGGKTSSSPLESPTRAPR